MNKAEKELKEHLRRCNKLGCLGLPRCCSLKLSSALREARDQQREKDAKVAENGLVVCDGKCACAKEIAAAIRRAK